MGIYFVCLHAISSLMAVFLQANFTANSLVINRMRMITVKNLSKAFGRQNAVDDLSFAVKPGDVVGFLGPNGAGKSTTMKMLTGFLTPSSGEVYFGELRIGRDSRRIQRQLGYLPEGAPAYGEMTPWQFLQFIAKVRGLRTVERKQRVQQVIEQVALQSVLNKPIDTLSKGFKRRVGLAQAILHDPQVLILDEPTDGLDPNQKHQVRSLIQDLAQDKIVIISTHILEEVTAVCNRVMIINHGSLLFDDTPQALLQRSVYQGAVTLTLSYACDLSDLQDIDGVADIEQQPGSLQATLFAKDNQPILHAINQVIAQRKLPVDAIYVEQGRLDEVFRTLTAGESSQGSNQDAAN